MLAHCAWADAVFFRVWADGDREDRELRERVAHASGVQENFLKLFRGEDDLPWEKILRGEVKPPWVDKPLPSFETLRDLTRANHEGLHAYAEGLAESDLRRPMRVPWFPDPPCVIPVGAALVQVAMHTQHHRGQHMTRVRQLGGQPKNVDYIIWLWKQRPEASWQ